MTREGEARRDAPPVVVVVILSIVAVAVCAWLGLWQWDRAHARASSVREGAPTPIADLLAPSSDAAGVIGQSVVATGEWGDDVALVEGREVDGSPAVLLVRSLVVPADEARPGAEARLAVLVGYQVEDRVVCADMDTGIVTVTGYFRTSEPAPLEAVPAGAVARCGAYTTTAISLAELAQAWPAPLYAAVLVADDGSGVWAPMPARDPVTRLNLQSVAYAAEWWVFGLFAMVVAFRWVRENGRHRTSATEGDDHD